MAKNGNGKGKRELNIVTTLSENALRNFVSDLKIAQNAVRKAQEENRRLGIPNWYSINGQIVSDLELKNKNGKQSK